ncbi:hypothetical protein [Reyranella soli]|uniref:hypothetical protein n=1 Tax=Reyranella soli TaxID=1230389 RepID=UPI0011BF93AE|nr:hypothetical protein [Reyranella soli]
MDLLTEGARVVARVKLLASDMQAKWEQLRKARTGLQRQRAELLAVGKEVSNELGNLKGLRKRLRAELSESNDIEEGPAADGFAQMEAEIEAMIASYWRPDHEMPTDLEELIRVLDTLDIRAGLQTSHDGVSIWISDRNYRTRHECLVQRDRSGLIPGVATVAQCLHEAAMQLFPKYASLHKAQPQRPATNRRG